MSTPTDQRTVAEIRAWIAALGDALTDDERNRAVEERLGLARVEADPTTGAPPGDELIGHHASSVDAIVRALREAPVTASDTFVDLGAGDGRAVFLARILTGARARGIELQPALVAKSRASAARLGLDVTLDEADARAAPLDDGTVFFMYTPFVGGALAAALDRLRAVAAHHRIVVCALGFELDPSVSWLVPRRVDSFWLEIYDSAPLTNEAAPRSDPG